MNDNRLHILTRPEVIIGTSGYSYPDWKNIFYPDYLKTEQYLQFYSQYFTGVELNQTFYKMPSFSTFKKFSSSSVASLELTVKAFKGITHLPDYAKTLAEFNEQLDPMTRKGRIQAILFQFPYSFRPGIDAWDQLKVLSAPKQDVCRVVEFRHLSWFTVANIKRLSTMNLSVCALDMPSIDGLPGTQFPVTHQVGYMRLHGRNTRQWWNQQNSWDRYNYCYTPDELEQIAPTLRHWVNQHRKTYIFFNNHFRGQAVRNAQQLQAFFA